MIFYYEWLPLIASLPNASRLKFYDIVMNPEKRHEKIEDDLHLKSVIDFVKIKILENEKKYEETIEARKTAGSKGGKQKVANAKGAKQKKQKVANVADNENVNVNDILLVSPKKGGWGDYDDTEDLKLNPDNPRAFCGHVIKLRQKDLDKLVQASDTNEKYMIEQLDSRDDWIAGQEPHIKKNWYMSTLKWAENMKEYA